MYHLTSYRRSDDELVIELKRCFSQEMVFPHIIWAVFLFVVFQAIFGPLGFFLFCFAAFCYYCIYREQAFLCYSAGTLRVIRRRDLIVTQWRSQRIYDRAEVPCPIPWIRSVAPGRRSFRLDNDAGNRYETRFPFRREKTRGVICLHKSRTKMLALQKTIDDFFAETPYDKAVFDRTQAAAVSVHAERSVPEKLSRTETKRNKAKVNESKRYAFDRGDTPLRRGDEPLVRGESLAMKRRARHDGYPIRRQSLVTVEEELSSNQLRGTLKLVSTTGGAFSSGMAALSMVIYHLGLWCLFLGGLLFMGMQYFGWNLIERHLVPRIEREIAVRVPEEYREPVEDAFRWYVDAASDPQLQLNALLAMFAVWMAIQLVFVMACRFVRWPFWKRWTVIMKFWPRRPHELRFSWRHDRTRRREPMRDFATFFRVIPATPKTNRLLTGRSHFSRNPGWKQPYQVVLITGEGSFPLPCGGIEEQEQIIQRVSRFAEQMLPQ